MLKTYQLIEHSIIDSHVLILISLDNSIYPTPRGACLYKWPMLSWRLEGGDPRYTFTSDPLYVNITCQPYLNSKNTFI